MVAFNFKAQFADDVESGKKRQTIRQQRRCKPGDALQLYTGMRTKKCRKLRDDICTAVHQIVIEKDCGRLNVHLDNERLPHHRALEIAHADGFENLSAFGHFFEREYGGLPFSGYLIRWG